MATYYVDYDAGSDSSANPTNINTPWKTIEKVRSSLPGGATCLLKRGVTWKDTYLTAPSGSSGSYTVIGAYGTGAKPRITFAKDGNTIGWTYRNNNIWRCSPGTDDIGNIVVNTISGTKAVLHKYFHPSDTRTGAVPKLPSGSLPAVQGAYFHNTEGLSFDGTTGAYLWMYSVGDPSGVYDGMELCHDEINGSLKSLMTGKIYQTWQDLDFRYNSDMGAAAVMGGGGHDQMIERCDFSYIGGSLGAGSAVANRDGYAIQVANGGSNITIRDITATEIWHRPFSIQTGNFNDLFIYRNLLKNCGWGSHEAWLNGGTITREYFVNNTIYNTCYGLYYDELAWYGIYTMPGSMIWYGPAGMSYYVDCIMKNNIIYGDRSYHHRLTKSGWDLNGWDIDYNCYYPLTYDSGRPFSDGSFGPITFTQWKSNQCVNPPPDSHSRTADPLFTNASAGDFTLRTGSPCISTGVYIPNISTVPYPSMGMYEGTVVTPAPSISGLNPNNGSTVGGTQVIITGANFTGATAVTFGGTNATSFAVNSSTQITAYSPAHTAGAVQVQVTTPGGQSANTAADDFTYTTVPTGNNIYYVKNGGSDSLDGKSDANAWATIAKVNAATLVPGDTVLFKRGGLWREHLGLTRSSTGTVASPVTFGAYGTGANPVICHGRLLPGGTEGTSLWTHLGSDIWEASVGSFDIGMIILNWDGTRSVAHRGQFAGFVAGSSGTTLNLSSYLIAGTPDTAGYFNGCHVRIKKGPHIGEERTIQTYTGGTNRVATLTASAAWTVDSDFYRIHGNTTTFLHTQGCFSHDPVSQKLWMRSSGNPATVYPDGIMCMEEVQGRLNYTSPPNNTYAITVQDIDFQCSSDMNAMYLPGSNTIIQRCNFSFVGGSYDSAGLGGSDGYALQLVGACSNIHVRYCTFTEQYDRGVSIQLNTPYNIYVHHNLFTYSGGAVDFNSQIGPGQSIDNIYIVHNTAYGMGEGLLGHLMCWYSPAAQETFIQWWNSSYHTVYVYNNICYRNNYFLRFLSHGKAGHPEQPDDALVGFYFDRNCYWPTGNPVDIWNSWRYNQDYVYDNIDDWKALTGVPRPLPTGTNLPDANSLVADPKFTNAAAGDFTLQEGSPCIGQGVYVPNISETNPPTLGCYEVVVLAPEPKLCPFRRP